jgi:hypothetical protein
VFDYTQSKIIKKNISWIGSVTTQARKIWELQLKKKGCL